MSGVASPLGFRAAATACGIKPSGLDLALIAADQDCSAAAVFTANRAQAAPVVVSRQHVASGTARAVLVNAGCANAGTGAPGLRDAREMAALAAAQLGCRPEKVIVASTGVIGVELPMEKIRAGVVSLARDLGRDGGADAAHAILTTDRQAKEVVVEFPLDGHTARVGAMAKGAGMIAPHLATMLAFFTTDAAVPPPLLRQSLREAVGATLNRITVDGDTSTNDMAVVLASGALPVRAISAEGRDLHAFQDALGQAAQRLAAMLIRDAEGATRVAEVRVEGARSEEDADRIARTVAESPLVKTAIHGGDPNWGRVLAAVGRAGVELDIGGLDLFLGDVWVAEGGRARAYDEGLARRAMLADPVRIRVRLRDGQATGSMWTCDLSPGYVEINSHYRS